MPKRTDTTRDDRTEGDTDASVPAARDLVAGLEKGLAVICAFDRSRPRLTISEVAQRCGLSRAAARRYLITLEHLGYLRSDEKKLYALTAKVLRLGQSYMQSSVLPRIVEPELHKLAHTLKEASSAGVLDGDDVICIAATTAGRLVSRTLQPGTRVPAWCTANGRVLLAALPPDEADAWIERQTLQALTPTSIISRRKLADAVALVRTQGWAAVDQELEPGLRTLSVPLAGRQGGVRAALNVSVSADRFTMQYLIETCLPPLRQAQKALRPLL
jgi:IclR family transcriptional regulator, pca regulon regulatory protein